MTLGFLLNEIFQRIEVTSTKPTQVRNTAREKDFFVQKATERPEANDLIRKREMFCELELASI